MKPLYLVRVNLHKLIGPFDEAALRKAHKNMSFGIADEICGDLKPWVSFDDLEAIQKHYPELVKFVKADIIDSWGGSNHKLLLKRQKKSSIWSSNLTFWSLLTIVTATLLLLISQKNIWSIFHAQNNLTPHTATRLIEKQRYDYFDEFIQKNLSAILNTGPTAEWLPLLRAYAYRHDGKVPGLAPELLLQGSFIKDQSCSQHDWQQIWQAPELADTVAGRSPPSTKLALLTWDPYWIRARTPQQGWLTPPSAYEACLIMASQALAKTPSFDGHELLKQRLNSLLQSVQSGSPPQSPSNDQSPLAVLSCYQAAQTLQHIKQCPPPESFTAWRTPLLFAHNWQTARIYVNSSQHEDTLLSLAEHVEKLRLNAPLSHWSYGPELRFYLEYIATKGDISKANAAVKLRFPSIQQSLPP